MIKIKLIVSAFLLLFLKVNSQNQSVESVVIKNVNVSESSKIKDVKLVTYVPFVKIQERYNDISEAKNLTPKELFISHVSQDTEEWYYHNLVDKEAFLSPTVREGFNKKKSEDLNKHYIELIQRLDYTLNGKKCTWVKFCAHYNLPNRRGESLYVSTWRLEFNNGRWERDFRYYDDIVIRDLGIMTCFKYNLLENIFTNSNPDKNPYMESLLNKIYVNNELDLDKLYKELKRMFEESKSVKTDELKYFEENYLL